MSRARELAKVGGLQQTISGVSTHVGISTFASDVYILGKLDITGDLGFDEMTAVNSKITGISTAQDLIVGTVSQVSRYDLQTITRQHSNPAAMTEQDPIEIPEQVHGYKKIPRQMQ